MCRRSTRRSTAPRRRAGRGRGARRRRGHACLIVKRLLRAGGEPVIHITDTSCSDRLPVSARSSTPTRPSSSWRPTASGRSTTRAPRSSRASPSRTQPRGCEVAPGTAVHRAARDALHPRARADRVLAHRGRRLARALLAPAPRPLDPTGGQPGFGPGDQWHGSQSAKVICMSNHAPPRPRRRGPRRASATRSSCAAARAATPRSPPGSPSSRS